jgi:hypothetical protein
VDLFHATSSGDERVAAEEWLAWAIAYRHEQLDPLSQPLRIPDDPEVTPDALVPFMGGQSPDDPPTW